MANRRRVQRSRGVLASALTELTAGDLARLLGVDLKTIHNWVNQGYVLARRTEGRHLRFRRVEVVRFLRRSGHAVPPEIGRAVPRLLVTKGAFPRGLVGMAVTVAEGFVSTILEVASGAHEILFLDLDAHSPSVTKELVRALREREGTRGIAIIGASSRASRRAAFVGSGGDLGVPLGAGADLVRCARYLTGSVGEPPRGALLPEPRPR